MNIPTEDDWQIDNSDWPSGIYIPDLEWAKKYFFEKTIEEVIPLIENNVFERSSDLNWMPITPFQYYILAFSACLRERNFSDLDASDFANCFLSLVLSKFEAQPHFIAPVYEEISSVVEYVANNQTMYDADEDIYGSFLERYQRILELAEKSADLIGGSR